MVGSVTQDGGECHNDDFNLYAYVGNDPLNRKDPTGQESACVTADGCGKWAKRAPSVKQLAAAADFVPVVGDIKGAAEAIQNPTPINIAAAVVGVVPGAGDVAAKAMKTGGSILENAAKGKAFQNAVGEAQDLKANAEKFSTSHGNTVPDFKDGANVADAKNVANLSNTRQMQAQRELATQGGGTHTVFVRQDTHVSGPMQQSGTRIVACNPDGTSC